jgi:glycosyltransferase involved in cell wall biosynthesis
VVSRHAVTPYGRGAGSSRVRVFSWVDRMEDPPAVHDYVGANRASPLLLARRPRDVLRAERDLRRLVSGGPDWLMLHREASPLSRGQLEIALAASAGFSVYDFDDALHDDVGQGPLWRRLAPKAPKAEAAVRAVDRVVAGNEVLADWASSMAREVVVVPSCVDVPRYRPKSDYTLADPPRLVWIGSRDNESVLGTIAPALLELHRTTGARLTVIGDAAAEVRGLAHLVDRVAWCETTQHEALADADLGIMPLVNDAYSRGKCGYKLLQYAAAALPAVANPVGTNATILETLGLPAATTTEEWFDTLSTLIASSAVDRARLGSAARDNVTRAYSFDAWMGRWLAAVGLPAGGAHAEACP